MRRGFEAEVQHDGTWQIRMNLENPHEFQERLRKMNIADERIKLLRKNEKTVVCSG